MAGLRISPTGGVLLTRPGGPALDTGAGISGGGSGGGGVWSGASLADVSPGRLTALWDASTLDGYRTSGGAAPAVWNTAVTSLVDKTGSTGAATIASGGFGMPTGAVATPRLGGAVGGVTSLITLPTSTTLPLAVDAGLAVTTPALSLSAGTAWTLLLLLGRPQVSQDYSAITAGPVDIVKVGGVPVLSLSNLVPDTMRLFRTGANVAIATGLTRAFVASITLRNTPGSGVDVWFGDTQVATGVTNPLSGTGALVAAGQTFFLTAARWDHALTSAEVDVLHGTAATAAAKRWSRGAKITPHAAGFGQSNASNLFLHPYYGGSGAGLILAEAVRYYLGALGCTIGWGSSGGFGLASLGGGGGDISSTGGSDVLTGNPLADAVAANYPLGARGAAVGNYITGLPADVQAMIAGFVEVWTEGKSLGNGGYSYATMRTLLIQQERQMLARYRALLGRSIPWFTVFAVPYTAGDSGIQGVTEMNALLAGSGTDNAFVAFPELTDTLPQGASYDAATGAFGAAATGGVAGDNAHRDHSDWPRMVRRAAAIIARVMGAQGYGDGSAWPAGLPQRGYALPLTATYEGTSQGRTVGGVATDTLLVTVQHDPGFGSQGEFRTSGGALAYKDPGGTLRPSPAAGGAGWVVLDGGTADAPAAKVLSTACERVDATHLRLTLASRLSPASRADLTRARLYKGYGSTQGATLPNPAQVGRGGGVYTFSTAAPPAGLDYAGDYGVSDDVPLATTPVGVAIT